MASSPLRVSDRLSFVWGRLRRLDLRSVWQRARQAAKQHGRSRVVVLVDMLWQAGFKNVAFQDYVDWDFAMLTKQERVTFMTHPISALIAERYDAPEQRRLLQHKITFNETFDEFLGREWLDLRHASDAETEAFVRRHGVVMGKVPVSAAGLGVTRYRADEVRDWASFRRELLGKGQELLEEVLTQHPDLAAVCPTTINTTRVTTFFDGRDVHALSIAQKFGRGAASDQQSFGGFYTMIDPDTGRSFGRGYDSHDNVWEHHPDTGASIPDFVLPLRTELLALVDRAARVVPHMQYVGWDTVVREHDAVVIEGNWGAGVYENKPSVTGIRTGSRPRFRAVIGF